ncbi:hypothetical protein RIR_jg14173.t1 [Rhizophagus irregularis DAOM 181602=DAOM 197198]|nr:hypothetical protein RIR_jg14173.t1 [Rhizophagus irregularis DAOM 181602=DAOM 197198]
MSRENVMRVEEMLIDYYSAIILKQSEVEGGLMVNNLNQQILALQNNPPIIQQPIMAGYAPKKFRGVSGEDPELWLQEFRQWCESAGLDPAANARTCEKIGNV